MRVKNLKGFTEEPVLGSLFFIIYINHVPEIKDRVFNFFCIYMLMISRFPLVEHKRRYSLNIKELSVLFLIHLMNKKLFSIQKNPNVLSLNSRLKLLTCITYLHTCLTILLESKI